MGSYPSGQRGLTVNQLSDDFGGSNPSLPTSFILASASRERPIQQGVPQERQALIAQLVEHALGKGEVMGSSPIEGSNEPE